HMPLKNNHLFLCALNMGYDDIPPPWPPQMTSTLLPQVRSGGSRFRLQPWPVSLPGGPRASTLSSIPVTVTAAGLQTSGIGKT
ncbi:MAG: hypothetical protein OXI81_07950, partial [Paracoccaceae bacterium]|nr:hypothetical protein [Paracoccaceae bacterium]